MLTKNGETRESYLHPVKPPGSFAEDVLCLLSILVEEILPESVEYLVVRTGKKTHRPITSEHKALGPENPENMTDIGLEVGWFPVFVISFGNHP